MSADRRLLSAPKVKGAPGLLRRERLGTQLLADSGADPNSQLEDLSASVLEPLLSNTYDGMAQKVPTAPTGRS